MSPRDYILPYFTLVHHLQKHGGANREELMKALQDAGSELSLRSFQRLLETIRADLGIHISYDAGSNQYHLEEMNSFQLGNFFRYCKSMLEAGFVLDTLRQKDVDAGRIIAGSPEGTDGVEWLSLLANCIRETQLVRVEILRNKGEENKSYTLLPLALKKEGPDWLLLAWQPKKGKWRQVNITRIQELQVKSAVPDLLPPKLQDALEQFGFSEKSDKK